MSNYSEVARIREDLIRLPFSADMFEAMETDRGQGSPWLSGNAWDRMFCPWHKGPFWTMTEQKTVEAIRRGGPSQLLTDEGWIEIDEQGIVSPPITNPKEVVDAIRVVNQKLRFNPALSPMSDSFLVAIHEGLAEGLTQTEIAKRLGVTRQKVMWALKRSGAYDG